MSASRMLGLGLGVALSSAACVTAEEVAPKSSYVKGKAAVEGIEDGQFCGGAIDEVMAELKGKGFVQDGPGADMPMVLWGKTDSKSRAEFDIGFLRNDVFEITVRFDYEDGGTDFRNIQRVQCRMPAMRAFVDGLFRR